MKQFVRSSSVLALLLLVWSGASSSLHAQDTVGPARWLAGDTTEKPAAQTQNRPVIAAGGSGYLVVWQDRRTLLEGALATSAQHLGNQQDVYAARLDASGALLDRNPLVISNGDLVQGTPKVVWNGEQWLVVFLSGRPGEFAKEDVVAVRVAPDGTVLDPQPFLVKPDSFDPTLLGVASDGFDWVVVTREAEGGQQGQIVTRAVRVRHDGTVPDTAGQALPVGGSADVRFDMAYANGQYLLLWSRNIFGEAATGGGDLLALRVSRDLAPLDALPFSVNATTSPSTGRLAVATDGTGFLAVWNQSGLRCTPVSAQGQVASPAGVLVTSAESREAAVAWNGSSYTVVFTQGTAEDLAFRKVDAAGNLLGSQGVLASGASTREVEPAIASSQDGVTQAAWLLQTPSTNSEEVFTGRIRADSTVGGKVQVSIGLPRQRKGRIVTHAGGHLLVYLSESGGQSRIQAQRLDAAGNPVDLQPKVVHQVSVERSLGRPDAAWNGSVYLVVWDQGEAIYGRRYAADLTALDAAPVLLMPAFRRSLPGIGALNGDFLVTASSVRNGGGGYYGTPSAFIEGVRVRGSDGALLDAAPFLIGAGNGFQSRVAALGDRWLVAWVNRSTSGGGSSAQTAFVSAAAVAEAPVILGYGSCPDVCQDDIALAVQGNQALVAWADSSTVQWQGTILARLLRADGVLGPQLSIASGVGNRTTPAAAGDGQGGWRLAWVDFRTVPVLSGLRGDIYFTQLDANGAEAFPGGTPVTTGPLPEDDPFLAPVPGSPGSLLLGFTALRGTRPVDPRIALRNLTPGAPPPPPPASTITSLELTPASATGGTGVKATLVLAQPAPAGGAKILLSSADVNVATVPASITIAQGATSATFTVSTKPVLTAAAVAVSASYTGSTKTAAVTVQPPVLSGLTLNPKSFAGGCQSSTGRVTLSGKAPAGGIAVTLFDSSAATTLPASVTVPAGATSATFPITAPAVTSSQPDTVTALYAGVSKTASLTVRPVGLLTLALNPNPVVGPNPVTGTVTLECAAPAGGTVVTLSVSATAVARPATASLTIPAGATTGTFVLTTTDVAAQSTTWVNATAGGVTKRVLLTVE